MNILGIGPQLAVVGGAGFAVVFVCQSFLGIELAAPPSWHGALRGIGFVLLAVGLYFWFSSAVLVERAFKSHRLVTSGVYRFTRNPLYAAFIVFVVPGMALVFNNLLILLISALMFAAFKMQIRREEEYLLKEFGGEFQKYAEEVPQLFPFV